MLWLLSRCRLMLQGLELNLELLNTIQGLLGMGHDGGVEVSMHGLDSVIEVVVGSGLVVVEVVERVEDVLDLLLVLSDLGDIPAKGQIVPAPDGLVDV